MSSSTYGRHHIPLAWVKIFLYRVSLSDVYSARMFLNKMYILHILTVYLNHLNNILDFHAVKFLNWVKNDKSGTTELL